MKDLRKARRIAGYIKLIRFTLTHHSSDPETQWIILHSWGGSKTYRKSELIKVLIYNKKLLSEELAKYEK